MGKIWNFTNEGGRNNVMTKARLPICLRSFPNLIDVRQNLGRMSKIILSKDFFLL